MSKYTHQKLADFIKVDSKNLRKKLKVPQNLSVIQNALSQVFGYRHFHELNTNNDNLIDISILTEAEIESLKFEYQKTMLSFSSTPDYSNYMFSKIKELESYYISGNNNKISHNFTKSELYFDFTINEFEDFLFYKIKKEIESPKKLIFLMFYVKIICQILRETESKNIYEMFFHYLEYHNIKKYIKENPSFSIRFEAIDFNSIKNTDLISSSNAIKDYSFEYIINSFDINKTPLKTLNNYTNFINYIEGASTDIFDISKYVKSYFMFLNKENTLFKKMEYKKPVKINHIIKSYNSSEILFYKGSKLLNTLIEFIECERAGVGYKTIEKIEPCLRKEKVVLIGFNELETQMLTKNKNRYPNFCSFGDLKETSKKEKISINSALRQNPDVIVLNSKYIAREIEDLRLIIELGFKLVII